MRRELARAHPARAGIFVVNIRMRVHPFGRNVKMLVYRIHEIGILFQIFARPRPGVAVRSAIYPRSRRTDNFQLGILFVNALFEQLEPLVKVVILRVPLLIPQPQIFEAERLRMSHFGAHSAPYGVRAAVSKLHCVQRVLNIRFQLLAVHGDRFV